MHREFLRFLISQTLEWDAGRKIQWKNKNTKNMTNREMQDNHDI